MATSTSSSAAHHSPATIGPPEPTPSYGPGGTFTISYSCRVAASPEACLDVVLTAAEYPSWNRFCRKCTIEQGGKPSDAQNQNDESTQEKLQLGTHFNFEVYLDPDAPAGSAPDQHVNLEVSVLEPIAGDGDDDENGTSQKKGWRIAWRQRPSLFMPAWMLHSERVQEFVEVRAAAGTTADNGGADGGTPVVETEYRGWETFYGVLAPVVRMAVGAKVERGMDAWKVGLKERTEGGRKRSGVAA